VLETLVLGDLLQQLAPLPRILVDHPDALTNVGAVPRAAAIHVSLIPNAVEDLAQPVCERQSSAPTAVR
jgi:hypothetical protein